MTGRELILYILNNGLENEEVIKGGVMVGLISEEKVAARFGVGIATVRTWVTLGKLKGIRVGNDLMFLNNVTDPRKTNKER